MFALSKKIAALSLCLISLSLTSLAAKAKDQVLYLNFDSSTTNQLTDKIDMSFITSPQFTVIQWSLKAGAKLPQHSHVNEQVIRILKGEVEVHADDKVYHLHVGDVMVFPSYVTHGFIATTDAVMYEQQTPIRQDFLQPGFIEKLSAYLKQNQ